LRDGFKKDDIEEARLTDHVCIVPTYERVAMITADVVLNLADQSGIICKKETMQDVYKILLLIGQPGWLPSTKNKSPPADIESIAMSPQRVVRCPTDEFPLNPMSAR
jgi:hypothetical protein